MKKTIHFDCTLEQYIEKHGTIKTARSLGLTKGAIWFMVNSDREIYIKDFDGRLMFYEVKGWQDGTTRIERKGGKTTKKSPAGLRAKTSKKMARISAKRKKAA